MTRKRLISAYTPSNTDPETRARIFVQRHKLLRKVISWCEESMLTGNKHHLLFIGPRGSGKTHLVAMVHDSVSRNPRLGEKMRVAWLGEDNVFTGLIDFALEIADELSKEYPDEFCFDYRGKAKALPADDAAEVILEEIISRLGDKSILLIMENLNFAFHGLGDLGQKKWRAFLQEKKRISTLATSQQLFEDISSRDAAFYGFFEILHLEPLSVDHASELMAKIARENDQLDLVHFLTTAEGRYRVRALHHLAGGNHRMYIMLSEFLTKESLDDLVTSFEELAEDLTPYFQERIRSLPPQQARIVQALCNTSRAMTVKEISEDTFISQSNVSKQLGNIKRKGYVVSEKRGKESFYDVSEPLMRLCLEVKMQRGKPLKLIAAFLRAWYSRKSLQDEFDTESGSLADNTRALAYRETTLKTDDAFQKAIRNKLSREFDFKMECQRLDEAMSIADELVYADRPTGLLRRSRVFFERGLFAEAMEEFDRVISLPGITCDQKAEALINRGTVFRRVGISDKAIANYTAVIEKEGTPIYWKAGALLNRGQVYRSLNESDQAIADFTAVIEMDEVPICWKAGALANRGYVYGLLNELDQEITDYSTVIEMEEAPIDMKARALANRGYVYDQLNESDKAIADYTVVIEMEEGPIDWKAWALANRGIHYRNLLQFDLSLDDVMAIIEMADVSSSIRTVAFFNIPVTMIAIRSLDESIGSIQRAFAEGDAGTAYYGGTPRYILQMILSREHHSWPEYIEKLIPVYAEYEALDSLGSGLMESIIYLDSGSYSELQLDTWDSAWQKFGVEHDELSISLSALTAAVQVIRTGKDRALFNLPLEVRQIVRPLLKNTLSEV